VVVRYEGTPGWVGLLAHYLEEEGLEVDYEPPFERKGALPEPTTVVLLYVAFKAGNIVTDAVTEVAKEELKAAIRHGIAKWRERGRGGKVTLEEE
jgi:hypothetical protein